MVSDSGMVRLTLSAAPVIVIVAVTGGETVAFEPPPPPPHPQAHKKLNNNRLTSETTPRCWRFCAMTSVCIASKMAIANTTKLMQDTTNQRCPPSRGIIGSNAITPEVLLTVTVNAVELRHRELQIKRLKSKAEKLGYRVTPIPAAA